MNFLPLVLPPFSAHRVVALLFCGAVALSAGVPIDYSAIERSGRTLPSDLARSVEDAFSVGQESWLGIHHLLVISPEAFPLKSPLGLHNGWPYQQALSFGALRSFGEQKSELVRKGKAPADPNAWRYGFFWTFERRGWAQEDFYIFRPKGEYAGGWSAHLIGALIDRPLWGLQFGAGVLGRNRTNWSSGVPKQKQQPWMGWGRVGWGAFQSWILAGEEVEGWSVALDLEKRALENAFAPGWRGYMPRIRLESEGLSDSLHFEWEQPLWSNRIYARTRWSLDSGLEWGELAIYPDVSRFFALAGSWMVRPGEKGQWGGLIRLGVAEIGYSYAPEMNAMVGMEQSIFFRIGFAISRLKQDLDAAPGAGGFSSGLTKKEKR